MAHLVQRRQRLVLRTPRLRSDGRSLDPRQEGVPPPDGARELAGREHLALLRQPARDEVVDDFLRRLLWGLAGRVDRQLR